MSALAVPFPDEQQVPFAETLQVSRQDRLRYLDLRRQQAVRAALATLAAAATTAAAAAVSWQVVNGGGDRRLESLQPRARAQVALEHACPGGSSFRWEFVVEFPAKD